VSRPPEQILDRAASACFVASLLFYRIAIAQILDRLWRARTMAFRSLAITIWVSVFASVRELHEPS